MPETRLIKKYANRRLYDTHTSSHVKLSDIRELIHGGVEVRIVADVSGDDLTRSILLQIITEEEQSGRPMLDAELLTRIIRLYGNPAQDMMGEYLLKSFDAFMQQQSRFQEQMRAAVASAPLDALGDLFQSNMKAFERMQQAMTGKGQSRAPSDDEPDDNTP